MTKIKTEKPLNNRFMGPNCTGAVNIHTSTTIYMVIKTSKPIDKTDMCGVKDVHAVVKNKLHISYHG